MLPNFQLFAINLYQKMFWYLPKCLIDWDVETGLLYKTQSPSYVSRLSFIISVFSETLFIISTVPFAVQVFCFESHNSVKEILPCLLAIQLSLMWTLGLLCQVILSHDWRWIEGFNQLIRMHGSLVYWKNYGTLFVN